MNYAGKSFDLVASVYDEVRPGYPVEVYDTVSRYKSFYGSSRILEVGSGQGVATNELFGYWGADVTAVEPGAHFCELMRSKFAKNGKITICNATYEDFTADDKTYDGIFSATAFHWLDPSVKYAKSRDLLKDDGLLVLYWNNYAIADPDIDAEVQKIYVAHGFPSNPKKSAHDLQNEKMASRQREVEESGLFKIVEHRIIRREIGYSTASYVKLLQTFPDHTAENITDISGFYSDIAGAVRRRGERIAVEVTVNLEVARKS